MSLRNQATLFNLINFMIYKLKKYFSIKFYRFKIILLFYFLRIFFGINIIYNKSRALNKREIKKYFNVLLVLESPAYAKKHNWFQFDYLYDLEASYRSKSNAEDLIILKDCYAIVDIFGEKLDNIKNWSSKRNEFVALFSNKKTLEGHKIRHEIYKLRKRYNFEINFYGSIVNRPFSSSSFIYNDYKYAIVVENELLDNYVSEKFFDAVKAKAFIFYYGHKKSVVELGFDTSVIVFFNSAQDLIRKLKPVSTNLSNMNNKRNLDQILNKNYETLLSLRKNKVMKFVYNLSTLLHINKSYLKATKNDWKK